TGFYLQDQMKFGQNWIVVAGLRYDRSVSSVEQDSDQTSTALTKRLGLMYAADHGWSPYLSYSESFKPVSGLNADNDRYVPMRVEQIEAGLKYESEDGSTQFNAAVYSLRENNRLVPDPTNPNNSIQAGKTKNTGLELELKTALGKQFDLLT